MEVRTHLGWRPSVIGLEVAEHDPVRSEEEGLEEGFEEGIEEGIEGRDPVAGDVSRGRAPTRVDGAGDSSTGGAHFDEPSWQSEIGIEGDEGARGRLFTGFEDPPHEQNKDRPKPASNLGRSGWISAIADAERGVDEDDPTTDPSLPEVTHTRLIESTDSGGSAASLESKGPEHLSLEGLDDEGDRERESKPPPSLSSQRLGQAVSRSSRGRGVRRRISGDSGGLAPLGALGRSEEQGTMLSKLREGVSDGPSSEKKKKNIRSLFDPVADNPRASPAETTEEHDVTRGSLRRGRRPVRRDPSSTDDDDPAAD